jgi:hypothetical protein
LNLLGFVRSIAVRCYPPTFPPANQGCKRKRSGGDVGGGGDCDGESGEKDDGGRKESRPRVVTKCAYGARVVSAMRQYSKEKLGVADSKEAKGGEMRVTKNLRTANVGRRIEVTSQHRDSDESGNENPGKKEGSFVIEDGKDVNMGEQRGVWARMSFWMMRIDLCWITEQGSQRNYFGFSQKDL